MLTPPRRPVRLDCDVLVIGGGTAGTMAALTAAEQRRAGAAAGEGARAPLGRARHGHGRGEQRRHPRQGRTRGLRRRDHPRQRRNRQPAHHLSDRDARLRDGAAARTLRREVREGRARRVCRAPRAPLGLLRAPDARGQGRQEGALPGDAAEGHARQDPHREPGDAGAGAHPRRAGRSVRRRSNSRTGEFVGRRREGGDPGDRAVWPARPARLGLPLRHLREPDQRGRRLLDGLSRRCRAVAASSASRSTR